MARILLIDDESALRFPIRVKLVAMGHTVEEASNGKIGLERFRAFSPDLVITDMVMPVMEGMETIQALRRSGSSVKIIAMSGDGMNPAGAYLRTAEKLGADYVLAKPFSHEELEAAVVAAISPVSETRTFLVLDDDATTRFLNRAMLETEFPNNTVVECGTVEEALTASCGRSLDAVITDHHLGESNGSEFVERLRAQGARCPILMVTGNSDPKVHDRAYAAGASRVFFGSDTDFTEYLRQTLKGS
jgi:CheY-like chemotaxis protein